MTGTTESERRRRAYRVAYDGREYAGFQRQPHARTVEGTLLSALSELGVVERGDGPTHATPSGYAAAGRTDAGVSAVAQTVAFDAPEWLTPRAFNGTLPGSIRVWAAADGPPEFHATHHATRRTYRYYLHAPSDDDRCGEDRLHDALARLSGSHDFRNLTPDDRGTTRDLRATAQREGAFLVVEVSADGFPRALVRRLVAATRLVATGRAEPSFLDRVLDPEPLPGHLGVGPAAPEPLVLWDVAYRNVGFVIDEEAAASARKSFDERHREASRAAAVTGAVRDRIGSAGAADDAGSSSN